MGRLIEIKCPYNRKIINEKTNETDIPHHYWV